MHVGLGVHAHLGVGVVHLGLGVHAHRGDAAPAFAYPLYPCAHTDVGCLD